MINTGIVSLSNPKKILINEDEYEMLAIVLLDVDFQDLSKYETLDNYLSQKGYSAPRRKVLLNLAKAYEK